MRLEEKGSIKTALKHVAGLKVRGARELRRADCCFPSSFTLFIR